MKDRSSKNFFNAVATAKKLLREDSGASIERVCDYLIFNVPDLPVNIDREAVARVAIQQLFEDELMSIFQKAMKLTTSNPNPEMLLTQACQLSSVIGNYDRPSCLKVAKKFLEREKMISRLVERTQKVLIEAKPRPKSTVSDILSCVREKISQKEASERDLKEALRRLCNQVSNNPRNPLCSLFKGLQKRNLPANVRRVK